jgi:hypothetical protein
MDNYVYFPIDILKQDTIKTKWLVKSKLCISENELGNFVILSYNQSIGFN